MSRKTKGVEHVESVEASEEAKRRLRVVLETIAERKSVEEAAAELGISAARFHEVRREALGGAAAALEPKAPGRPSAPAEDPEKAALRHEIQELRIDLEASRIREEIAIVMPHVLKPRKKGGPGTRDGGRSGT